ncbi:MAG TPA: hypothetical protein VGI81_29365 [Tepidisphaeraceae bacterium]|jgi:hypothetical protein
MRLTNGRRGGIDPVRALRIVAGPAIESLEFRRLLSTVTWTGAAGDNTWTSPNNWTDGTVARLPGPADDVNIGPGPGTIVNVGGTINSLATARSLSLTGSLLTVSHGITLNRATVTLFSPSMYTPAGLVFAGDTSQTLGGTGSVVFTGGRWSAGLENKTLNPAGAVTMLRISPGITIHGSSGFIENRYASDAIVNDGVISADTGSGTITLPFPATGTLINRGTLSAANGATLTIDASWRNMGILTETNGTLNLGGTFTTHSVANLRRVGGTMNVTGTLDNTGATLALTSTTGSLVLPAGGQIVGGTIAESGGARLVPLNGTLDGVTLDGNLNVVGTLNVKNGLTLGGGSTITLGSAAQYSYGVLQFADGSQTFGGTGTVVFASTSTPSEIRNGSSGAGDQTLTIGPGLMLHGHNGSLVNGDPTDALANEGTILADATGGTVSMPSVGTWSNTGNLAATAGTLNLYGNFTTAGLGHVVSAGGAVNIAGTLDNTAATLNLNAATGSWGLVPGGRIRNGTIVMGGGAQLMPAGGDLDGVTLASDLLVAQNESVYISDGLTLSSGATLTLGSTADRSSGALDFTGGSETLGGIGTIVLAGNPNDSFQPFNYWVNGTTSAGAGATLTIGPNVTVRGMNAVFDNLLSGNLLVNQGTILADVPGGRIEMPTAGAWANTGMMTASAGTLDLNGSYTTASLGTIRNTGGAVNINGTLDNTGSTLALGAATGSWNLWYSGTIENGTITEADGAQIIPVAGTLSGVTLAGDLHVDGGSLYVRNGLTLQGAATITIGDATRGRLGSLYFGGPSQTVGGTGSIVFGVSDVLNACDAGAILTIGPGVTMRGANCFYHQNGGTSTDLEGSLAADVNGGIVYFPGQYSGGGITVHGTIAALNGGTLSFGIGPTNYDAATHTLAGGTWSVGAGSTLTFPAGTSIQTNAATINLAGNGSFPALAGLSTNSGTTQLTNSTLAVTPAGGAFTNNGTLSLDADSTLSVTGAFAQTSAGTLSIEIDGPTAGGGFGQVKATGNAALDGTLDATLGGGYDPAAGTSFPVVVGSTRSGTFAAFIGNRTPGGLSLAVAYDATSARVVVQSPPTAVIDGRAGRMAEGTLLPRLESGLRRGIVLG